MFPGYFKTEQTFEKLISFLKDEDEAVGKIWPSIISIRVLIVFCQRNYSHWLFRGLDKGSINFCMKPYLVGILEIAWLPGWVDSNEYPRDTCGIHVYFQIKRNFQKIIFIIAKSNHLLWLLNSSLTIQSRCCHGEIKKNVHTYYLKKYPVWSYAN